MCFFFCLSSLRASFKSFSLSLSLSLCVQTLHRVTPHKRPLCRRKSPAAPRLGRKTRSTRGTSEGRLPFTWQQSGETLSKLKSSLAWELMSMSKTLQVRRPRRWSFNSFHHVPAVVNNDIRLSNRCWCKGNVSTWAVISLRITTAYAAVGMWSSRIEKTAGNFFLRLFSCPHQVGRLCMKPVILVTMMWPRSW